MVTVYSGSSNPTKPRHRDSLQNVNFEIKINTRVQIPALPLPSFIVLGEVLSSLSLGLALTGE